MSNRVAFVTGGAQGIGQGISETLGASGFRVAVADLRLPVRADQHQARHPVVAHDVQEQEAKPIPGMTSFRIEGAW